MTFTKAERKKISAVLEAQRSEDEMRRGRIAAANLLAEVLNDTTLVDEGFDLLSRAHLYLDSPQDYALIKRMFA